MKLSSAVLVALMGTAIACGAAAVEPQANAVKTENSVYGGTMTAKLCNKLENGKEVYSNTVMDINIIHKDGQIVDVKFTPHVPTARKKSNSLIFAIGEAEINNINLIFNSKNSCSGLPLEGEWAI